MKIVMGQTLNLLEEKEVKTLLKNSVIKQLENGVKYLIINENEQQ
jgi:hypothetical protein